MLSGGKQKVSYQVIISGAGPVGTWLACELQLAGVATLVLDQAPEISPQSRALTIHPRTIETFAMRGAHHRMLEEAVRIPRGHFAVFDHWLDFRHLNTSYAFTLAIPQARITALLQERAVALGADVRRGHRVTDFVEHEASVSVSIVGPDGPYRVEADYLAGCDGTRSVVRQSADIDFAGTNFTVLGWLTDVVLTDPPDGAMIGKWGLNGTAMVAKLPNGEYRVVGISPDDVRTDWPGELTFEEVRSNTIAIFGTDFGMHSPSWLSRYSNTSRQAEIYRKGRVVLAGDAAHQHFPAGGVGLNVGIQDAMNLGWKLAATINGWAPESLLDSYHQERHPVGQDLLEHTQAQTSLMSCFTIEGAELRSFLNKLVKEHPSLEATLAERLSGLHVAYPASTPGAHPLVGRCVTDLEFDDGGKGLFSLLEKGRHVLLDLTSKAYPPSQTGSRHLEVHRGRLARKRYAEWAKITAALIRPDGYVEWASEETDAESLANLTAEAMAFLPRANTGVVAELASEAL